MQGMKQFMISLIIMGQKMKKHLQIIQDVISIQIKANVLILLERFKEAILILNDGTENVFFPHKYLDLGIAYQGVKKYEDACQFYFQFIFAMEEQKIYLPYYYRGTLYLQLNNKEEALNDFNQCIELNPNFAEAYIEIGQLQKDEEKAKFYLEYAVKLSPNNPFYLTYLGLFYYNTMIVDEAFIQLSKVDNIWREKGLAYFKQKYILTSSQIHFIQQNLEKFQRLIRNEKKRSLSIQHDENHKVESQQKQIAQLQQQVTQLAQEQRKIKKSLSPIKKKVNKLEKGQIIYEKILNKDIIIMNNWDRLKMPGNECERLYCECLFWKLSSFINACIQANTQIFLINPQEIAPNNNSLQKFFIESSIVLFKIIGFVPSIGAIATIIGETLQDISESAKKMSFKEKIQKIALVAQKSTVGENIDKQIQLATFEMGSVLIKRQFIWKKTKSRFYNQVEKMAQLEKNIGKVEAIRLEYLQAIEDSLYILQHIIEESKLFLEKDFSLNEVILYIFKQFIYKT